MRRNLNHLTIVLQFYTKKNLHGISTVNLDSNFDVFLGFLLVMIMFVFSSFTHYKVS